MHLRFYKNQWTVHHKVFVLAKVRHQNVRAGIGAKFVEVKWMERVLLRRRPFNGTLVLRILL